MNSKFLSLILRHQPDKIGVTLDSQGWVLIEVLLEALNKNGHAINAKELDEIVAQDNKQRYAFDNTHTLIRANQGHSIAIDLDLPPSTPPEILYHGTSKKTVESIKQEGISKQGRQHVHLSSNHATATQVGGRHGKPEVLEVKALKMSEEGFLFYLSENNVWLTDHVPAQFIVFPNRL